MFKIVICEDNPRLLDIMSMMISKILKNNKILGEIVLKTSDAQAVNSYLTNNSANIFFLDIVLDSGETGFELAKQIRVYDKKSYIVFTTGRFEYALKAFKVKAFDFLPKPVMYDVLEECLLRIKEDYFSIEPAKNEDEHYINIKHNRHITRLKISEIVFIEKNGFKVVFHTFKKTISCYDSLSNVLNQLNSNFIRCHKSFIANSSLITQIDFQNKSILFKNGAICLLGDKYKKQLQSILK